MQYLRSQEKTLMEKLEILTDAAKYVVYTIVLVFTDIHNKNYYTI